MLKKQLLGMMALITAAMLVFSFVGCGGNDATGPKEDPDDTPADANYDDLWDALWKEGASKNGPTSLKLADNFQYGDGYQTKIKWSALLNTDIKKDDVYQLEMTFTVSRDLEGKLQWVLVNDDPGVDYWQELSEWKPVVNGNDKDEENPPIFEQGQTITYVGRVVATMNGPKASSNLALDTSGDGTPGTANSGVKGEPTLTFTKFTITKLGWGQTTPEEPPPEEPPPEEPPPEEPPAFTAHDIGIEDGLMVEVAWDSALSPVIVNASDASYFEIVFSTGTFTGGFGHFATYPGSLGYSEVKYTLQADDVDADNKFVITKGDLVAAWKDNVPDWDGEFNSVQIQIYGSQTTAQFESITFYEED